MALIVTIYFGLVYQSSKESATIQGSDLVKWMVFVCVFTASSAFMLHFIAKMHAEALKIAVKKKTK